MIKKTAALLSLCFLLSQLQVANAQRNYVFYYNDTCPGSNKITHVPNQHWNILDSEWSIVKEDTTSSLHQFSANTPIERLVKPFHIGNNLAQIECNYNQNTLVLTRTYHELHFNSGPNFILADTNKPTGNRNEWPKNWFSDTSCTTSFDALEKCDWSFYRITSWSGIGPY